MAAVSVETHDRPADETSRLAGVFAQLGRELLTQRTADETLALITHRAVEVIPAAEHAAVSRGRPGRFETVAATSDLPIDVDSIQYRLGHGACVDAILDDNVYRVGNLGAPGNPWPVFGEQARGRFGINSLLSVRIFLEDEDLLAGLNLYSGQPHAFADSDQTTAILLATQLALALTAVRRLDKTENLGRALETSRRIGAAIGILMARHNVPYDGAFGLLRIASQTSHHKLNDIAEEVLETGILEIPPLPEEGHHP